MIDTISEFFDINSIEFFLKKRKPLTKINSNPKNYAKQFKF